MSTVNTKINDSVVISAESNSNNTIVANTKQSENINTESVTDNTIVAKTRSENLLVIKLGN